MAIYNWRDGSCRRWGRCFDLDTGLEVPGVFFWYTDTNYVGRFETDANGVFAIGANGKPIEVWEYRRLRIEWSDEKNQADTPILVTS